MKYWVYLILALLMTCAWCRTEEQAEQEQMEEDMVRYKFLLQLIEQFDNNGKGSVKKQDYAQFLAKVFIVGNQQQGYTIPDVNYLKRATLAFAQSKQQQEIGVQDFYEDLLSKFYQFLSDKDEYQELIGILFEGANKGQIRTPQNTKNDHETLQL